VDPTLTAIALKNISQDHLANNKGFTAAAALPLHTILNDLNVETRQPSRAVAVLCLPLLGSKRS